jgi:hypothetical protein
VLWLKLSALPLVKARLVEIIPEPLKLALLVVKHWVFPNKRNFCFIENDLFRG